MLVSVMCIFMQRLLSARPHFAAHQVKNKYVTHFRLFSFNGTSKIACTFSSFKEKNPKSQTCRWHHGNLNKTWTMVTLADNILRESGLS